MDEDRLLIAIFTVLITIVIFIISFHIGATNYDIILSK